MIGNLRILVCLSLLPASTVLAHHSSSAVYDLERTVEITGELAAVSWSNPHVKLTLAVADASGATAQWVVEANTPSLLERRHIPVGLFHVGDTLRVAGHPGRRAPHELFVDNILLPDGREVLMRPLVQPRWSSSTIGRDVSIELHAPSP